MIALSTGVEVQKGESHVTVAKRVQARASKTSASLMGNRGVTKSKSQKTKAKSTKVAISVPGLTKRTEWTGAVHGTTEDYSSVVPQPHPGFAAGCTHVNLLVIGAHGAGATALSSKFVGERISEEGSSRIVNYSGRYLPVRVTLATPENVESFNLTSTSGILIVCDVSDFRRSFEDACKWNQVVRTCCEKVGIAMRPVVLAINKYDAATKNKMHSADIDFVVMSSKVKFNQFFKVSALTGMNVDECFMSLINLAALTPIKVDNPSGADEYAQQRCVIC